LIDDGIVRGEEKEADVPAVYSIRSERIGH
jgi:hypothetical protein